MTDREIITKYHPYVSIRPDKAVFRVVASRFRQAIVDGNRVLVKIEKSKSSAPNSSREKLERKFHNFQISKNSRKNLIEKILWLNQFAKARTIKTYTGKLIYNFRTSFITLTLPASQAHSTSQISNECFDRFLTMLRNRLGMVNYVWKLEFQDNGNVHYHLLTDTYVDYFFALKHWNAIIDKLGYVTRYQESMQSLSFQDYRNRYGNHGNTCIKLLASRYAKGVRSGWRSPNSVDVRAVRTQNNLHYYLSKYFAKSDDKPVTSIHDSEDNSFGLRLCFWSRSLSRVSAESMPESYYDFDFHGFFELAQNVVLKIYDYCRVVYFSIAKLSPCRKRALYILFSQMKLDFGYTPAA